MSTLPLPSEFDAALSVEALSTVAGWLLEEQGFTDDDLRRPTDTAYSRGCTSFARQHSRIVLEWKSGKYPWLSMANSGSLDLVFHIGGVPCRFARDNLEHPSKSAVVMTHEFQLPFAEFARPGAPARYCFVVERGVGEDHDHRVVFAGFSALGEIVCRWESDRIRRVTRVEEAELPKAVNLDKPSVTPKRRKTNDDGDGEVAPTAGA